MSAAVCRRGLPHPRRGTTPVTVTNSFGTKTAPLLEAVSKNFVVVEPYLMGVVQGLVTAANMNWESSWLGDRCYGPPLMNMVKHWFSVHEGQHARLLHPCAALRVSARPAPRCLSAVSRARWTRGGGSRGCHPIQLRAVLRWMARCAACFVCRSDAAFLAWCLSCLLLPLALPCEV